MDGMSVGSHSQSLGGRRRVKGLLLLSPDPQAWSALCGRARAHTRTQIIFSPPIYISKNSAWICKFNSAFASTNFSAICQAASKTQVAARETDLVYQNMDVPSSLGACATVKASDGDDEDFKLQQPSRLNVACGFGICSYSFWLLRFFFSYLYPPSLIQEQEQREILWEG